MPVCGYSQESGVSFSLCRSAETRSTVSRPQAIRMSQQYLANHAMIARRLGKPLVLQASKPFGSLSAPCKQEQKMLAPRVSVVMLAEFSVLYPGHD
eukprot:5102078-Pleurochrysis_carterae.AAC.11